MGIRSGAAIFSAAAVLIVSGCSTSTPTGADAENSGAKAGTSALAVQSSPSRFQTAGLLATESGTSSAAGGLTATATAPNNRAISWSVVVAPDAGAEVTARGANGSDANVTSAGVAVPTNVV